MPHWLRCIACSVLYTMFSSLVTRAYLYGISDNNVYRLGLYSILPTLFFFSLDLLFRLIKMYLYGLKILENQKKEKEKEKEE